MSTPKEYRSPMAAAVPPEGHRPEQTFFPDPALDRAFGVVMALATEVYVLRDRLAALEAQLEVRGMLDRAALARVNDLDGARRESAVATRGLARSASAAGAAPTPGHGLLLVCSW